MYHFNLAKKEPIKHWINGKRRRCVCGDLVRTMELRKQVARMKCGDSNNPVFHAGLLTEGKNGRGRTLLVPEAVYSAAQIQVKFG